MTDPLATRDAIAEVLERHVPYGGGRFCECLPVDEDGCREVLTTSWEGHLADALIASGAGVNATKLIPRTMPATPDAVLRYARTLRYAHYDAAADILTALAAALSAQRERAEDPTV